MKIRFVNYFTECLKYRLLPSRRQATENLISAVQNYDTEGVRAALEAGADPNAHCGKCYRILHIAASFEVPLQVRLLIQSGANRDAKNAYGQTAADMVRFNKVPEIAVDLLRELSGEGKRRC